MSSSITSRYRLLDLLGTGSMGEIYRAYDRLSGQEVALKRVVLAPTIEAHSADDRRALAHEFRTLAGLRHPHIISVLDYGFDVARQPFFTMELLEGTQSIQEAGADLPVAKRALLLIQALEALAYLHRRGILHHDLKPANIVVAGGSVRLLDFGLAVLADQPRDNDAFGTLLYLAPEVLDGKYYTAAADLYSLGVVAYELLTGQHPFEADSTRGFLRRVRTEQPDLRVLADQPLLAELVGRLLARDPATRMPSAEAAIAVLQQAIGHADARDSALIRESYLQAATFVGRADELAQLRGALDQAAVAQGSSWLIGGESGVGKSRLLDELRTEALVAGFRVALGQAAEDSGMPYQIWRQALPQLVPGAAISDLDAGVLKELIPNIAQLLDRPVPDAPALPGEAGEQRLSLAIVRLVRYQPQPTLLILEDLHWSGESLAPLVQLSRVAAELPLLILASYRDDERPQLPSALPGMRRLPLGRLSAQAIAELSRSMIGEAGAQAAVVQYLQRETEGNVFFLIEVLRALAEQRGSLALVGRGALPAQVLTGGLQQVVQRRLRKVPRWGQALLRIAALAGRQLDLRVLAYLLLHDRRLLPGHDLEHWLLICKEVAVLDVREHTWSFAHDKLRAAVQLSILDAERRQIHQRLAGAIEQTYAPALAVHYGALAHHYAQARNPARERHFARLSGEQAAAQFAHAEALAYLSRALDLTPADDPAAQFALLLTREQVYDLQGARQPQARDLAALAGLAEQLADDWSRAEVAARQARYAESVGDYAGTIEGAQRAAVLAAAAGALHIEASAYIAQGIALRSTANCRAAQASLEQGLTLAQALALPSIEAPCLNFLGSVETLQGQYAEASEHLMRALALSHAIGDRRSEILALNFLGTNAYYQGDLAASQSFYQQALGVAREIDDRREVGRVLANLGDNYTYLGDFAQAHAMLEEAVQLNQSVGDRGSEVFCLLYLSRHFLQRGDYAQAEVYGRRALLGAQDAGMSIIQGLVLVILGRAVAARRCLDEAADLFQQAGAIYRALDREMGQAEVAAWLAVLALERGQLDQARAALYPFLPTIERQVLRGVDDPFAIYLDCYQVLASADPARAAALLRVAYHSLIERAGQLGSAALRAPFLAGSPARRALAAAWQRHQQAG